MPAPRGRARLHLHRAEAAGGAFTCRVCINWTSDERLTCSPPRNLCLLRKQEVDRPGVPPAATCPFPEKGGEDVLVEIEAPIREGGGGGLLKSIEAAREAAATLQE